MNKEEDAPIAPSGKKAALGPGETLKPMFHSHDCDIVATLFCGDKYYWEHPEEVEKKFIGFAKKFEIDAVLCNPAAETYKSDVIIVKMPKKGGIGLQDSFKNMALATSKKAHAESLNAVMNVLF